jgi:hypothetical protein
LKVSINENQVAGLKSGNTVAVTASVPWYKFAGKITFIAQWQIQAWTFL